ncbi:hypothetical protein HGI47_18865 [Novosphingobium sp. ERN07]|uniref:hypothetical protein n=1 Tax=Novosphingobium sp. ERN07 TaxID=2726187 RepID=UPI00145704AB|nr:hypothetical protein [Novosphingobium sp. ERN07]NLR72939.1 hypothetical protein [Novosphingobium sp. ERN07]
MRKLIVAVIIGSLGYWSAATIKAGYDHDLICEPFGKYYRGSTVFRGPVCLNYFEDGQQACSTKNDCQGRCIAPAGSPFGSVASGRCEAYQSEGILNGQNELKDGRAKAIDHFAL